MTTPKFQAIVEEMRERAAIDDREFLGVPAIDWLGIAVDQHGQPAVDLEWNSRPVRVSRGDEIDMQKRALDFNYQIEGQWLDTGERAIWTSTDAVEFSVQDWGINDAYGLQDLLDWAMAVGFTAAARSL